MYASALDTSRRYEVYMTDVTTGETSSRVNMLPATPADHPVSMFNGVHRYRADICNGSHDLAYYVFAHWPSNGGAAHPCGDRGRGRHAAAAAADESEDHVLTWADPVCRKPLRGDMAGPARRARRWLKQLIGMSAFDWLPPVPWRCPRCCAIILTREAGPRCPRCGLREGT